MNRAPPEFWSFQAELAMDVHDTLTDPAAREVMLEVAISCHRLAMVASQDTRRTADDLGSAGGRSGDSEAFTG